MTQYNEIGETYNVIERLPFRKMEGSNIREALKPILKPGMKAIDFACGTGYYSAQLLDWGCAEVTGVDISSVMIDGANKRFRQRDDASRATFLAADASEPRSFAPNGVESYFDMSFGCWFLNYAPSFDVLVAMFKTAALNLRDDGVFVTIVPHPTNELAERALQHKQLPMTTVRPQYVYPSPLDNGQGWNLQVVLSDNVKFMTYHLAKDIYEKAARAGGFAGELTWVREKPLGPGWADVYPSITEQQLWEARDRTPHLGILIVNKN